MPVYINPIVAVGGFGDVTDDRLALDATVSGLPLEAEWVPPGPGPPVAAASAGPWAWMIVAAVVAVLVFGDR